MRFSATAMMTLSRHCVTSWLHSQKPDWDQISRLLWDPSTRDDYGGAGLRRISATTWQPAMPWRIDLVSSHTLTESRKLRVCAAYNDGCEGRWEFELRESQAGWRVAAVTPVSAPRLIRSAGRPRAHTSPQ